MDNCKYIVKKTDSTGDWFLKSNLNWSDSIEEAKQWKCKLTAEMFARSENAEIIELA